MNGISDLINNLPAAATNIAGRIGSGIGGGLGRMAYGQSGSEFGGAVGNQIGQGIGQWFGGKDVSQITPGLLQSLAPMIGGEIGSYAGNRMGGNFYGGIGRDIGQQLGQASTSYMSGNSLKDVGRQTALNLLPTIESALRGNSQQLKPSYANGGYVNPQGMSAEIPNLLSMFKPVAPIIGALALGAGPPLAAMGAAAYLGTKALDSSKFSPYKLFGLSKGGYVPPHSGDGPTWRDRASQAVNLLSKYAPYIAPAVGLGIGHLMSERSLNNPTIMDFNNSSVPNIHHSYYAGGGHVRAPLSWRDLITSMEI